MSFKVKIRVATTNDPFNRTNGTLSANYYGYFDFKTSSSKPEIEYSGFECNNKFTFEAKSENSNCVLKRLYYKYFDGVREYPEVDINSTSFELLPTNEALTGILIEAEFFRRYQVIHNLNGGNVSISLNRWSHADDNSVLISDTIPTKNGYIFQGWRINGTNEYLASGTNYTYSQLKSYINSGTNFDTLELNAIWVQEAVPEPEEPEEPETQAYYAYCYDIKTGSLIYYESSTSSYFIRPDLEDDDYSYIGYVTGYSYNDCLSNYKENGVDSSNISCSLNSSYNRVIFFYESETELKEDPEGFDPALFKFDQMTTGFVRPKSYSVFTTKEYKSAYYSHNKTFIYPQIDGQCEFSVSPISTSSNKNIVLTWVSGSTETEGSDFEYKEYDNSNTGTETLNFDFSTDLHIIPGFFEKNGGTVTVNIEFIFKPKYSLSYYLNEGQGTFNDTFFYYYPEVSIIISPDKPTKEGYQFLGWSLTQEGEGSLFKSGQTISGDDFREGDITLYAVWKETKATITYNANGGTFEDNTSEKQETKDLGLIEISTLSIPTRTNYIFKYWIDNQNNKYYLSDTINLQDDLNLSAVWWPTFKWDKKNSVEANLINEYINEYIHPTNNLPINPKDKYLLSWFNRLLFALGQNTKETAIPQQITNDDLNLIVDIYTKY